VQNLIELVKYKLYNDKHYHSLLVITILLWLLFSEWNKPARHWCTRWVEWAGWKNPICRWL